MSKKMIVLVIFIVLLGIMLCGCTISINVIHTKGNASDLIDEVQSPTNTTTPTVSLPISGTGI